ncbi:hypothetical protein [Chitinophaga ginsengisegetis]|uniref:hypothetical protein n=1 Tax=Chitinophaga ginsengisegetis TaxID=393003 RepID=UPI000DB94EB9|nr:hypothetical protein [Chitinophaga ginsengisegetis]MDR6571036.1 hypothetical protein [Chitinophaga ginsengisegetis]MDR6650770.1 hypothetical protein [Chitinophaga ginsengisegetis]MDR6657120.1 hypothetical protein [Chitinophaga ginsengisegetis]
METSIIKYQRKIIGVERKLGFLYISAQGQEFLPSETSKVLVALAGISKTLELSYNADYKRIFGLTNWYNKNNISAGSILDIELTKERIKLSVAKSEIVIRDTEEGTDLVNLSGLSSGVKGNIVEDRIKELILLYGQGLLNVYKPVVDNRGIDLIVMKNGFFYPIFIQVKSRFNAVKKGSILIDVGKNTFSVHNSFYIVGAAFNPTTLEMEDRILFIPSKDYETNSTAISVNGKNKRRFTVSLKDGTTAKGAKYFIKKSDLVERLMEKFEEMGKYYK